MEDQRARAPKPVVSARAVDPSLHDACWIGIVQVLITAWRSIVREKLQDIDVPASSHAAVPQCRAGFHGTDQSVFPTAGAGPAQARAFASRCISGYLAVHAGRESCP